MYEPYIGELFKDYRVVEFVRIYYEMMVVKVQHLKTGQECLLKYIDVISSPVEVLLMMVNEIRVLSSIDHPLFLEYIESFVDIDKGVVW